MHRIYSGEGLAWSNIEETSSYYDDAAVVLAANRVSKMTRDDVLPFQEDVAMTGAGQENYESTLHNCCRSLSLTKDDGCLGIALACH